MEKQQPQIDTAKKYLNLILSRRRLIAAFVLLAVSAGLLMYLATPKVYESSASIIYQEQRINPSRFSPDEERQMREMVNTVSQQVLSRANLENLIRKYGLYQNPQSNVAVEDLIAKARDNISVTMERDRGNVFSVSFQGGNPSRVMQVTDWLALKFIEENLRVREERARETSDYIKDELQMAKARLDKKEAEMKDYKLKYYNEMPDQRASNMTRLNALQEQFQALQTNIYNLEQTRLLMSEQLEVRRNMQEDAAAAGTAAYEGEQPGSLAQELSSARRRLQDLLSRYTPQHPEVKRQEHRIRRIETEIESARPRDSDDAPASDQDMGPETLSREDSRIAELKAQIREIDVNLKTLRKESNNILEQIRNYQKWVEAAPVREAEWASLTRDYEELKQYHDQLLSQSFSAEAAETLEISQKGSQFKIVDQAYLPKTPAKGTFLKILMASLFVGLAAGMGTVLGLDFMNTSFKQAEDIENYLKLPVTCALPLIVTETEKKNTRIRNTALSAFLFLWLAALAAAAVYFWQQGEIIV